MAKYTSSLVATGTGRIGGLVLVNAKTGGQLRKLSYPVDPFSPGQSNTRAILSYVAQTWKSIGITNQNSFKALALLFPRVDNLHRTYYLSAFQMYQFLNLNLALNNQTKISVAPSIATNNLPAPTGMAVTIITTPGNLAINLTLGTSIRTGVILNVQSSGVVSNGVSFPKNFKLIASLNSSFLTGETIMNYYTSVFGVMPATGDKVYFKVWFIDTVNGWVSSKIIFYTVAGI